MVNRGTPQYPCDAFSHPCHRKHFDDWGLINCASTFVACARISPRLPTGDLLLAGAQTFSTRRYASCGIALCTKRNS